MAQASLEKFAELVEDLKVLKASSIGDGSVSSMEKAREQRIEELKDTNGTLEEVCVHNDFSTAQNLHKSNPWAVDLSILVTRVAKAID